MEPSLPRFPEYPRAQRGLQTGPNPTDRGKSGSKHHLLVDRQGLPLAVTLSAANVADLHQLEPTLEAVAPLQRPGPGRPVKRPAKLHADKAYDARWCRQACRRRGIRPRIARRGVESSQRLGRHRWVVERTLAWLRGYRRLRIRDERRADIHQAFLKLGCALILFNHLQKFC